MSTRLSLETLRINWPALQVAPPDAFAATPNVVPGQHLWNVRHDSEGKRELISLKWGLVPGWAEGFFPGTRQCAY